jgi:hypothetical protein
MFNLPEDFATFLTLRPAMDHRPWTIDLFNPSQKMLNLSYLSTGYGPSTIDHGPWTSSNPSQKMLNLSSPATCHGLWTMDYGP